MTVSPERRYSKQFIPASQSKGGMGHWRIADAEDNRVATCWDSYNADRIVEALNFHWNRRAVSEGPAAPTEGILISDISRAVRAWNDCEVDSDLVRMKRALLADRASRRAPVTHDPEGPAASTIDEGDFAAAMWLMQHAVNDDPADLWLTKSKAKAICRYLMALQESASGEPASPPSSGAQP